MTTVRTHYQNLHIEQTATPAEIRAAYKALCQKYHPDKQSVQDAQTIKIFNMINTAYRVLSDPDKRVKHDLWIREQNKKNTLNKQHRKKTHIPNGTPHYSPKAHGYPPGPSVQDKAKPRSKRLPRLFYIISICFIVSLLGLIGFSGLNKLLMPPIKTMASTVSAQFNQLYQHYFVTSTPNPLLTKAQFGDPLAQRQLKQMYFIGSGVEIDPANAAEWIKRAAERQNPTAQWALAYCYQQGYGVKKSYQKAHIWYKKSALKGSAEAQFSLGLQYLTGQGTKPDDKQAALWMKKAALNDNLQAKYYLAYLYQHGRGLKKDSLKAIYWYQKAAEKGDFKSVQALIEMGVL